MTLDMNPADSPVLADKPSSTVELASYLSLLLQDWLTAERRCSASPQQNARNLERLCLWRQFLLWGAW